MDVPEREQAAAGGSVPPGAGPRLPVSPLPDHGGLRAEGAVSPTTRGVPERAPETFRAGLPGIEVSTS
ncbi:hypothetical protein ACF1B0_00635 [Streptomyces anandii]|uniref:hypothetical protein n=1 Tax=Streptomyces anandii TaxID=285454 RepID=UPI0036F868DA